MAITSVDIDPQLLEDVKTTFGVKTNREAIHRALLAASGKARMLRAIHAIAQVPVDPDPKSYDELHPETT